MPELKLTDMFRKEHFQKIENAFRKHFKMGLETNTVDGTEITKMCSCDHHPEFCKVVRSSRTGARRCLQDRMRGLNMALETGQPYITFCHAGIVLACVPIMDQDCPLGGLFFGKCLWEEFNDDIGEDMLKRLSGLRINKRELLDAAMKLPVMPGRRIHQASEFLYILLYETAQLDPRVIQWRRFRSEQQSEISEIIQQNKRLGSKRQYPYESEQALIGKVKIGDRTGAKEILNSILANILLQNPGELNVLKARMVELLGVLSRAAAEGGVDINMLLEKNLEYINTALAIDTQENLCAWITQALNDFIKGVYDSQVPY